MLFIRLLPVTISCWLLAAHFLRFSLWVPVMMLLLFPVLLFIRSTVVPKLVSFCLVLMAAQWVLITYDLVNIRLMVGEDWGRMAVIMLAVVSFTLGSICCFYSEKVRSFYSRN